MQFSGNVAYTKQREWEQYLVPVTLAEALTLLRVQGRGQGHRGGHGPQQSHE